VELMPRAIMREAKAWRIEWNEMLSIPASFAAASKPRRVALRCLSGLPFLAAKTGALSAE
jgi:hypothetical protein